MPEQRHAVGSAAEIPAGQRKLVEIEGHSIGVFNVHGNFVAVLNVCPHESAPVCKGRITGTTLPSAPGEFKWARQGEILACPWHGWEFDLTTGQCLTDKRKLHRYPVVVEDGIVYVKLRR